MVSHFAEMRDELSSKNVLIVADLIKHWQLARWRFGQKKQLQILLTYHGMQAEVLQTSLAAKISG